MKRILVDRFSWARAVCIPSEKAIWSLSTRKGVVSERYSGMFPHGRSRRAAAIMSTTEVYQLIPNTCKSVDPPKKLPIFGNEGGVEPQSCEIRATSSEDCNSDPSHLIFLGSLGLPFRENAFTRPLRHVPVLGPSRSPLPPIPISSVSSFVSPSRPVASCRSVKRAQGGGGQAVGACVRVRQPLA
jgi:hypothetical protein